MLNRNHLIILFIFLVAFDLFIWSLIIFNNQNKNLEVYFFDIGQGDSEMVILPGNVKVLIDGGPDKKILSELADVLSPTDRYIDLIILSHPQMDHFAGLIDVLKRYKIGAFIYNGRAGEAKAFKDLENAIKENLKENGALKIILAQSDKIKYRDNVFDVLSPPKEFLASKELNDTTLVLRLSIGNFRALFTGDIGENIEKYLVENFNIGADVLKVGHHGSKFSSGEEFLKKTNPKISVIEVGKNSYGHPTTQTLTRLANIGSQIFRTDFDGIIKLVIHNNAINIFKKKW
ncbi:MAG: MBL fold metallo-hydrolase [Patescibacteria group bacterium]